MRVPPFLLDRWLTAFEFADPPIRYNLASSTGPGWTMGQLLQLAPGDSRSRLEELALSYAPPQGHENLRARIAALHGVSPDCVVVTTGASEALSALLCMTAEPGANVVLPFPVFPAIPVLAKGWGLEIRSYVLSRENEFRHEPSQILEKVDARTALVLVNTPHNPSGAVFPPRQLALLANTLEGRGVKLVVDEVYHPLYFDAPSPSAARLPGAAVLGDLSKALSLSGLRVGWIIEPDPDRRQRLIDLRSYFTISNSPVTELLATLALEQASAILDRLKSVAQRNLGLLENFMEANGERIGWVRPSGGTVCFPWLVGVKDTRSFCEALAKRGVLIAPGDCFESPQHLRIGFGAQADGFDEALALTSEALKELRL